MRQLLIAILILIPVKIFPQVSGVVIDKSSGYPIQYANIMVENENTGTASDIEGKFTLRDDVFNKILTIFAVGFITERIVADSTFLRIELKTKIYQFDEAFVTSEKINPDFIVDNYNKDSVPVLCCFHDRQRIFAKYFGYNAMFKNPPHISKMKILINNPTVKSTFKIRLLNADNKGKPDSRLLKYDLIRTIPAGQMDLTVDLAEFQTVFPKNGFFVAVEWLADNSQYEPCLGLAESRKNTVYWVNTNGRWRKGSGVKPDKSAKPMDLAIMLVLTE